SVPGPEVQPEDAEITVKVANRGGGSPALNRLRSNVPQMIDRVAVGDEDQLGRGRRRSPQEQGKGERKGARQVMHNDGSETGTHGFILLRGSGRKQHSTLTLPALIVDATASRAASSPRTVLTRAPAATTAGGPPPPPGAVSPTRSPAPRRMV